MHGFIVNGVYTKREDEKQKLRIAGGSWTINLAEIAGEDIKLFVYKTPKFIYEIESETAYKRGFIRRFKDEAKLIVPIKYWTKEKN